MVSRQPVTRRGRQEGRLTWYPGAEGLELLHDPFSQADPLLSLGSGQIYGCLWRGAGWSTRNRLLAISHSAWRQELTHQAYKRLLLCQVLFGAFHTIGLEFQCERLLAIQIHLQAYSSQAFGLGCFVQFGIQANRTYDIAQFLLGDEMGLDTGAPMTHHLSWLLYRLSRRA
jgi:hypothetical protein